MVFPVVLRGLPGTSTRNCPHGTSTSKPVVPVRSPSSLAADRRPARSKKALQQFRDRGRLMMHPPPRDPPDSVPGKVELGVTDPVPLERHRGHVVRAAVDLDDPPLLAPERVYQVPG